MTPPAREHGDAPGWQAELLRLTAFPVPGTPVGQPSWWRDLTGSVPDVRTNRPAASAFQDEGLFQDLKLVLAVQPSRIDWHLAIPDQGRDTFGPQTMGALQDALKVFVPLVKDWLRVSPPLQRLAFGAVLLRSVGGKVEGYELLAKCLPGVKIDAEHSSDFSYRINRPRDSSTGIESLKVNRLSKWSVAFYSTGQVAVTPQGAEMRTLGTSFAVRLELDTNTPADFAQELPRERLNEITDELVSLGVEIADKGDIP